MKNTLKIVKINLLSIISLILLIISIISLLLSKIIQKLLMIVGLVTLVSILKSVLEIFHPIEINYNLLIIFSLILICPIIVAVYLVIILLGRFLISLISKLSEKIFRVFGDFVFGFFERIYKSCIDDYKQIKNFNNSIISSVCCLFFTIIKVINQITNLLLLNAFKLSIISCLIIIILPIIYISNSIKRDFGVGIIKYLSMFDWYSNISGILIYSIVIIGMCIILVGLSRDLQEMGQDLKIANYDCYDNVSSELYRANSIENNSENELFYKYLIIFNEHLDSIKELEEKIKLLEFNCSESLSLKNKFNIYIENINDVLNSLKKQENESSIIIDNEVCIKINQLDSLKEDILELIEIVSRKRRDFKETSDQNYNPISYFNGCNNKDALKKRYKDLCKIYHPDMELGDEETFKQLQIEYERLKNNFN